MSCISQLRKLIIFANIETFIAYCEHYDKKIPIYRFSRPLMIFAASATLIIMTIGLFGNLLTIVALIKCPKVRNVAADFIIR